jgi:peptidoglycan hydrolase CwlO-like protein
MSLERIDRYIQELTCIKDYTNKWHELNDAYSLISHLQKELNEKDQIILRCETRIEKLQSIIAILEEDLSERFMQFRKKTVGHS